MTATPDRLAAALADRYRVERELGAGGMATVYLATDVRHQGRVALKVLHPELSAVLGPERFLKEIEYALGAVTYEMLTGEAPFTGANAQAIVARVLTTPPAPITQTRSTVPARVEHAVLTALAKLPADRFGTARDFAIALVAPAGDEPARDDHRSTDGSTAASVRATRTTFRPFTRVAAALALGATAAVSFVAGQARTESSDAPIREFGRAIQATWERGLEVMPTISPDGKQVAYATGTPMRMRLFVRPVAGGRATPITDDYIKVSNAAGNAEVWVVSSQGAEPRFVTALGDARRRSDQFDFDVARGRMYFTVKDVESDVWVIDVVR